MNRLLLVLICLVCVRGQCWSAHADPCEEDLPPPAYSAAAAKEGRAADELPPYEAAVGPCEPVPEVKVDERFKRHQEEVREKVEVWYGWNKNVDLKRDFGDIYNKGYQAALNELGEARIELLNLINNAKNADDLKDVEMATRSNYGHFMPSFEVILGGADPAPAYIAPVVEPAVPQGGGGGQGPQKNAIQRFFSAVKSNQKLVIGAIGTVALVFVFVKMKAQIFGNAKVGARSLFGRAR